MLVKEAIRAGEIPLEPTIMPPPPKFKGRKIYQNVAARRAEVAEKMMQMPEMIAEYRRERYERRQKQRKADRWK